MAEGHRKLDPSSLPGLLYLVREEQLEVHRKLSELFALFGGLERRVRSLEDKAAGTKDTNDHDISSG